MKFLLPDNGYDGKFRISAVNTKELAMRLQRNDPPRTKKIFLILLGSKHRLVTPPKEPISPDTEHASPSSTR